LQSKGEGSVKSNTEELGGWVECKRGPSQSELGLMRSLMEICTEEAIFTFSGVDWEAPFQGPFFKVVEGLQDSVSAAFSESGEDD